ncbi:MAG: hypothetical protein ACI4VM_07445 [Anaerovoracaceae bacterium]
MFFEIKDLRKTGNSKMNFSTKENVEISVIHRVIHRLTGLSPAPEKRISTGSGGGGSWSSSAGMRKGSPVSEDRKGSGDRGLTIVT